MKPELTADLEIQKAKDVIPRYLYLFLLALGGHSAGNVPNNSNAIQAEKYAAKLKENGLTPMSYETYLLAQMQAIKAGNPLDAANWSLLLDSNLKNSQYLAHGHWSDNLVFLHGYAPFNRYDGLRLRPAVNVV